MMTELMIVLDIEQMLEFVNDACDEAEPVFLFQSSAWSATNIEVVQGEFQITFKRDVTVDDGG